MEKNYSKRYQYNDNFNKSLKLTFIKKVDNFNYYYFISYLIDI